jgi:putative endonuclease
MKGAAKQTTGSSSKPKTARQGLGKTGERLAAEELERRGYRLLERNFRGMRGEIDLIVVDERNGDLVFVEVKTRRGNAYGLPEEAVTFRKRQKLLQVAAYYLDLHEQCDCSWRIDVVAIQMSQGGKLEEIRVYEHAITGEM